MPGEFDFDIEAASTAVSSELGFGDDPGDGELSLDDPSPSPAPAPADPAPSPPAPAPAPADPYAEAPKTWRKEAAAEWAALTPTVRAEIAKREQDIFQGLEGYKTDATFGKSVQQAIQPYLPTLRQFNIDPLQQISGLMQAHFNLATGSAEAKLQTFQRLAKDYGIDLGQLNSPSDQLYVDPAVQALQSKFSTVESRLQAADARAAAAEEARFTREIETFAADPANTHFKTVINDMVQLMERGAATGLKEAYEKAIWLNPATRQAEISRQQQEAAAKLTAEEAARAEAARKATSANVKPKPKSAGAATPLGSMDDTIAETLAAIKARSK